MTHAYVPTRTSRKYIEEIASATLNDGGVAYNLNTHQFQPRMDVWSFPKYPGRTAILPQDTDLENALEEFILANKQFLCEPDCWLGTWINPHTHDFYLDIATGCTDLEKARELAFQASQRDGRKIVAIYNSLRKETVYLQEK